MYPYVLARNDIKFQTKSNYFRRVVRFKKDWPLFSKPESSIVVSFTSILSQHGKSPYIFRPEFQEKY